MPPNVYLPIFSLVCLSSIVNVIYSDPIVCDAEKDVNITEKGDNTYYHLCRLDGPGSSLKIQLEENNTTLIINICCSDQNSTTDERLNTTTVRKICFGTPEDRLETIREMLLKTNLPIDGITTLEFEKCSYIKCTDSSECDNQTGRSINGLMDHLQNGSAGAMSATHPLKAILDKLKHLTNVTLKSLKLTSVPGTLFSETQKLKKIDLSCNRLVRLDDTLFSSSAKTLVEISLRHNRLINVSKNLFEGLSQLGELDLAENCLTTIDAKAYIRLLALRTLNLSGNKFETFEIKPDLFPADEAQHLDLDLSSNRINTMTFDVHMKEKFRHMKNRKITILLDNNQINCTSNQNYEFLVFVKDSFTRAAPDLNQSILHIYNKDQLNCYSSQRGLQIERLRDVDLDTFLGPCNKTNYPENCSCQTYLHNETKIILNCKNLPSFLPSNFSIELSFQNTSSPPDLKILSNLTRDKEVTKLNLSNTFLTNVDGLDVMPLKELWLDSNKLEFIDQKFVRFINEKLKINPNLKVSLHNNSWRCGCNDDDIELQRFVRETQDLKMMNTKNEIECNFSTKKLMISVDLCHNDHWYYIIFGLVCLVGILSVSGFYIYFRYEIKLFLYTHRMFREWILDVEEEKPYDAFISYCYKNSDFVADHLLPNLEDPPHNYKICIHERDWFPGPPILEQIRDAIANSRRIILVLSRDGQDSAWVNEEFKQAYHRMVLEGISRLIIILYEDLDPNVPLCIELEDYLKRNTYLKWDNTERFWNRLRFSLTHRLREQNIRRDILRHVVNSESVSMNPRLTK